MPTTAEYIESTWDKIPYWYNVYVDPKLYRAYQNLQPVIDPIFNWVLLPLYKAGAAIAAFIYNWFIYPIYIVASTVAAFINNWIITPIKNAIQIAFTLIAHGIVMPTYNGVKNNIFTPIICFISGSIIAIKNSITLSAPFIYAYDLLQIDKTWSDEAGNSVAYFTSRATCFLFFTLAITPIMLFVVGASGNCLVTFSVIFMYSAAVATSFGATISHISEGRTQDAAKTASLFTGLTLLGLVYINLVTGGPIIMLITGVISFFTVCFALAQQPGTKDLPFIKKFDITSHVDREIGIRHYEYMRSSSSELSNNANKITKPVIEIGAPNNSNTTDDNRSYQPIKTHPW